MSGCWTGPTSNGAVIEEHYTEASENLLIGMTTETECRPDSPARRSSP
jgi:hypothetical protein